jgi:proline dehydrogenase
MSGLFAKTLRPAILSASRSDGLRRTAERLPVTRKVVHRFVPGATLDRVLDSVAVLRDSGRLVSIDYLGEDVADVDGAKATTRAYLQLLDALSRRPDGTRDGVRPLEVSLKLSALGQALDRDGEKIAFANAHTICERAQQVGAWVTVDAEDHTTTDSTLATAAELRTDFPWLGVVLQPASVAYRDADEVTDSYLRCLAVLMQGSGYPMVASHDPVIIDAVPKLVSESDRGAADFEYQMLYGIRDVEQLRLASTGNQVRVYVPFGTQWYGYFMRRLAERPANLTFFMRALAQRGH